MKTILTLIFVLFISVAAQAQDTSKEVKVVTVEAGIVTQTALTEILTGNETKVARLYKFKNAKIKKELSFTTKRNKAKLA